MSRSIEQPATPSTELPPLNFDQEEWDRLRRPRPAVQTSVPPAAQTVPPMGIARIDIPFEDVFAIVLKVFIAQAIIGAVIAAAVFAIYALLI